MRLLSYRHQLFWLARRQQIWLVLSIVSQSGRYLRRMAVCIPALANRLSPRAVIGDMDSVGALDQLDPAIERIHQTGQNDTDFEKCINLIHAPLIIGFGFLEIYVLHPIYKSLNLGDATSELEWLRALKFLFFVMMIYLVIAVLYFFGTKDGKLSRFFSVGALLTTLLILLNSSLFGMYIENFSTYNQLYGSIGALLILLFYLWLNAIILLLGFELNASLQRLKKSCQ